jgi:hypothetical protein
MSGSANPGWMGLGEAANGSGLTLRWLTGDR